MSNFGFHESSVLQDDDMIKITPDLQISHDVLFESRHDAILDQVGLAHGASIFDNNPVTVRKTSVLDTVQSRAKDILKGTDPHK